MLYKKKVKLKDPRFVKEPTLRDFNFKKKKENNSSLLSLKLYFRDDVIYLE